MIIQSCRLAFLDYIHEKLLSICAIFSLAAVLAPLLILYGVKYGLIYSMTQSLENNPRTLEVIPIASGNYSAAMIKDFANLPSVALAMPRTRSLAATMDLKNNNDNSPMKFWNTVSLEPTFENWQDNAKDIFLNRYIKEKIPTAPKDSFGVTLSAEIARKLNIKVGDKLIGRVERVYKGNPQGARVNLFVQAILPLEAEQKDVAYIPLSLLEATEDYRDGRRALDDPRLIQDFEKNQGWIGDERPKSERIYASFRLYAKSIDDVEILKAYFDKKNIAVYTKAEDIAAVRALNTSLNLVFALISLAAGIGFWTSTTSNVLANVHRKEQHLGILRLLGYNTTDIMVFPIFQSILTGILGTGLATSLYAVTAFAIDKLFAQRIQAVQEITLLPPWHWLAIFGLILCICLLASLIPALRATRIEPSTVIRQI